MCGGCGAGPHDEMGPLVAGPRRRAAVAAAAADHVGGLRIRVADRAWTVSEPTGKVIVCRTVDQLLDLLGQRGADTTALRSAVLKATGAAPPAS